MRGGLQIRLTERFERDYKSLSPDIRNAVDECMEEFERDPLPPGRRPHSVTARGHKPMVYTMDVTSNKSHKLSFQLEGNVAVLRRIGTHKQIDRSA